MRILLASSLLFAGCLGSNPDEATAAISAPWSGPDVCSSPLPEEIDLDASWTCQNLWNGSAGVVVAYLSEEDGLFHYAGVDTLWNQIVFRARSGTSQLSYLRAMPGSCDYPPNVHLDYPQISQPVARTVPKQAESQGSTLSDKCAYKRFLLERAQSETGCTIRTDWDTPRLADCQSAHPAPTPIPSWFKPYWL